MVTKKDLSVVVGIGEHHTPLQRPSATGNFFYMTYPEKLKDPRWQKRRLEIFTRDNWTCLKCGDTTTTLNVHHLKYTGNPWDAPDHDLKTLCEDCHSIIDLFCCDHKEFNEIKFKKINAGIHSIFFIQKTDGVFIITTAGCTFLRKGDKDFNEIKTMLQ